MSAVTSRLLAPHEPLGSPGGAAKVGAVLRDAEFVANYQVPET